MFYIENKEYRAENILLTISGTTLTEKEIEELRFKEFMDKSVKPDGTIRFVVSNNFGYVEEFRGVEWIFLRRLTKKEITNL